MTLGELVRWHKSEIDRARRSFEAIDTRVTGLASSMVDARVYAVDQARLTDRLAALAYNIEQLAKNVETAQDKAASQRLVILSSVVFPIVVLILGSAILAALRG